VRQLQRFEDEEEREDPIYWSGPVLAGDRLIVAGSNREVWSVSPYTGKLMGRIKAPGPVYIAPAVASETVFLLTEDAELVALR
jgi:outer membrane protein assembly factor BamB